MKLHSKFIIIISIIIISIVLIISFLFFMGVILFKWKNIETQANILLSDWRNLQLMNREILVSSKENLSVLIKKSLVIHETFRKSNAQFIQNKNKFFVNKEFKDNILLLETLWTSLDNNIKRSEEYLYKIESSLKEIPFIITSNRSLIDLYYISSAEPAFENSFFTMYYTGFYVSETQIGEETTAFGYVLTKITDQVHSSSKKFTNNIIFISGIFIIVLIVLSFFLFVLNGYLKNAIKGEERLKSEMKIAQHIQTSILPKEYSIPGYQICPYMKPAEEVGGDYYDIINTDNDTFWINIGDVTGHGLTAGLIMMMLQTSALSNINVNTDINPVDLIINSNKTIYDNIKNRMLLDQYITALFVKGKKNGEFEYAGAHEEILIYRNKNKKVERLETKGMWLGLSLDIKKFTQLGNFKLDYNDFFILFTDGVIEIMNEKREQYDIERLMALLEKNGDKEPDEIKNLLLSDIESFKYSQKDDITFVIVKKVKT